MESTQRYISSTTTDVSNRFSIPANVGDDI